MLGHGHPRGLGMGIQWNECPDKLKICTKHVKQYLKKRFFFL